MKLLFAAFLFVSSVTMACGQQEAQFIGFVKNYSVVQVGNTKSCSFEIQ